MMDFLHRRLPIPNHRGATCSLSALLLALLLAVGGPRLAAAQDVPAKGEPGTLEVATWNIEQFGSRNGVQFQTALSVIRQSNIDLWGIEEITDTGDFRALLDSLGDGYNGTYTTYRESSLELGFVWRTDVIESQSVQPILEEYQHEFARRPPFQLQAQVTLPDTSLTTTFIVLHAKCCGDQSDYERREEASERLKNHIDFTSLASEPVVILGDFNDELETSIATGNPSPYENFLNDSDHFRFLTLPLDESDTGTYCGNERDCEGFYTSTLDHILVTNELFEGYVDGSAQRYEELLQLSGGDYVYDVSDHLPVYARFDFAAGTAREPSGGQASASIQAPHPNPFQQSTMLRYTLRHVGQVQIDVLDVLGRRVRRLEAGVQNAGTHRVVFEANDLPPGLYLVRFRLPGLQQTLPVTLAR